MITESKVTEIFCIADDFCKEFEVEMAKNSLPSSPDAPKRRRKRMMSDAEVITILICFHFNTYRNFKHYYLSCVCGLGISLTDKTSLRDLFDKSNFKNVNVLCDSSEPNLFNF